ncbi:acetyl-CoA hydrolase [Pseudidiomarina sp. 1ASP75-14]|uniref:acetyl-CoA hydrolase/transferase C-terminal domain-containing protein n=1 Tax=Pseudidiomarina terrestris TaxID=2820060 RepID=UPI0026556C57|nr:acetyl-CoA hydrolase/transferase C-terminal domain-containing protein [Pseudidiomarina sp. 1ASP75-14]MDN7137224.1 acetyl-CoA hydrolase [Pseudidiomarina sp. 1ASP75-14]
MRHDRPRHLATTDDCVEQLIERVGKKIILGLPLGLGKPVHFTNALYQRAKADASIDLHIVTALSLVPPAPGSGLKARFMIPIIERLYGDVPELDFARDVLKQRLPDNVKVSEFFFQTGAFLKHDEQQRRYICTNYTHAIRDLRALGINAVAQLVAADNKATPEHISLSCNPDLSLDLFQQLRAAETQEKPIALIAECNQNLPFFALDAAIPASTFDFILQNDSTDYPLFPVPQSRINAVDHMIGFYASSLLKDGGTLQVGIGSLGSAVVYSTCLRHEKNTDWNKLHRSLKLAEQFPVTAKEGGTGPFKQGLYGCSEMMVEGFLHLLEAGILTRNVYPDAELQEQINQGAVDPQHGDDARLKHGVVMHGGFFLGPNAFYQNLQRLPEDQRERICMTSVNYINNLTNHRFGDQRLKVAQRINGRFINSAIKCTLNGALVSDGLEDGRVLSGVGGQYNFVAMAHELPDARSIITLRSTRTSKGKTDSTIVFSYGHCTIPRHLRDIVVTEYGIADLRGKKDEEIYLALIRIADARFQPELLKQAKDAGKVAPDFQLPSAWQRNTPAAIEAALKPFQDASLFPPFPFGTELTDEELQLQQALQYLNQNTATLAGKIRTFAQALVFGFSGDQHAKLTKRMKLNKIDSFSSWYQRRLLILGLKRARIPSQP